MTHNIRNIILNLNRSYSKQYIQVDKDEESEDRGAEDKRPLMRHIRLGPVGHSAVDKAIKGHNDKHPAGELQSCVLGEVADFAHGHTDRLEVGACKGGNKLV